MCKPGIGASPGSLLMNLPPCLVLKTPRVIRCFPVSTEITIKHHVDEGNVYRKHRVKPWLNNVFPCVFLTGEAMFFPNDQAEKTKRMIEVGPTS